MYILTSANKQMAVRLRGKRRMQAMLVAGIIMVAILLLVSTIRASSFLQIQYHATPNASGRLQKELFWKGENEGAAAESDKGQWPPGDKENLGKGQKGETLDGQTGPVDFNLFRAADFEPTTKAIRTYLDVKKKRYSLEVTSVDCKQDWIGCNVHGSHKWEPALTTPLEMMFQKNPELNLIDIGCNIGIYSLIASVYGRKSICVDTSFEELTMAAQTFRINNFFNNVLIINNLIGIENNYRSFHLPAFDKVCTSSELSIPYFAQFASKKIQMDNLLPLLTSKYWILKIDIEGNECQAFQYSKELLETREIQVILMEWGPTSRVGNNGQILSDYFTSLGYRVYDENMKLLHQNWHQWPGNVFWIKNGFDLF